MKGMTKKQKLGIAAACLAGVAMWVGIAKVFGIKAAGLAFACNVPPLIGVCAASGAKYLLGY